MIESDSSVISAGNKAFSMFDIRSINFLKSVQILRNTFKFSIAAQTKRLNSDLNFLEFNSWKYVEKLVLSHNTISSSAEVRTIYALQVAQQSNFQEILITNNNITGFGANDFNGVRLLTVHHGLLVSISSNHIIGYGTRWKDSKSNAIIGIVLDKAAAYGAPSTDTSYANKNISSVLIDNNILDMELSRFDTVVATTAEMMSNPSQVMNRIVPITILSMIKMKSVIISNTRIKLQTKTTPFAYVSIFAFGIGNVNTYIADIGLLRLSNFHAEVSGDVMSSYLIGFSSLVLDNVAMVDVRNGILNSTLRILRYQNDNPLFASIAPSGIQTLSHVAFGIRATPQIFSIINTTFHHEVNNLLVQSCFCIFQNFAKGFSGDKKKLILANNTYSQTFPVTQERIEFQQAKDFLEKFPSSSSSASIIQKSQMILGGWSSLVLNGPPPANYLGSNIVELLIENNTIDLCSGEPNLLYSVSFFPSSDHSSSSPSKILIRSNFFKNTFPIGAKSAVAGFGVKPPTALLASADSFTVRTFANPYFAFIHVQGRSQNVKYEIEKNNIEMDMMLRSSNQKNIDDDDTSSSSFVCSILNNSAFLNETNSNSNSENDLLFLTKPVGNFVIQNNIVNFGKACSGGSFLYANYFTDFVQVEEYKKLAPKEKPAEIEEKIHTKFSSQINLVNNKLTCSSFSRCSLTTLDLGFFVFPSLATTKVKVSSKIIANGNNIVISIANGTSEQQQEEEEFSPENQLKKFFYYSNDRVNINQNIDSSHSSLDISKSPNCNRVTMISEGEKQEITSSSFSSSPSMLLIPSTISLLEDIFAENLNYSDCTYQTPTSAKSFTISLPPPSPFYPQVESSIVAANDAATTTTMVVMAASSAIAPGLSFSVARQQSMMMFVSASRDGDCGGIDVEVVEKNGGMSPADSPMQLVIGTSRARFHLGSVIGNFMLLLILAIVGQGTAMIFVRIVESRSRNNNNNNNKDNEEEEELQEAMLNSSSSNHRDPRSNSNNNNNNSSRSNKTSKQQQEKEEEEEIKPQQRNKTMFEIFARFHVALVFYVVLSFLHCPILSFSLIIVTQPYLSLGIRIAFFIIALVVSALAIYYSLWSSILRTPRLEKFKLRPTYDEELLLIKKQKQKEKQQEQEAKNKENNKNKNKQNNNNKNDDNDNNRACCDGNDLTCFNAVKRAIKYIGIRRGDWCLPKNKKLSSSNSKSSNDKNSSSGGSSSSNNKNNNKNDNSSASSSRNKNKNNEISNNNDKVNKENDNNDEKITLHFLAAAPFIDGYNDNCHYFALVEFIVQFFMSFAAFLAQIIGNGKQSCLAQGIILILVMLFYIGICIIKRPFVTRIMNVAAPLITLPQLLTCILALIESQKVGENNNNSDGGGEEGGGKKGIAAAIIAAVSLESAMGVVSILLSISPAILILGKIISRMRSANRRGIGLRNATEWIVERRDDNYIDNSSASSGNRRDSSSRHFSPRNDNDNYDDDDDDRYLLNERRRNANYAASSSSNKSRSSSNNNYNSGNYNRDYYSHDQNQNYYYSDRGGDNRNRNDRTASSSSSSNNSGHNRSSSSSSNSHHHHHSPSHASSSRPSSPSSSRPTFSSSSSSSRHHHPSSSSSSSSSSSNPNLRNFDDRNNSDYSSSSSSNRRFKYDDQQDLLSQPQRRQQSTQNYNNNRNSNNQRSSSRSRPSSSSSRSSTNVVDDVDDVELERAVRKNNNKKYNK